MTYKRIVIPQSGGPEALQVVEVDLPEPPPGEVRVKVLTVGVLLADVMWQGGKVPGGPKPPFTPGYDLVGVVDKLGDDVSGPGVGQTVAAMIQPGGYTQYAFLPPEKLVPVPEGLDPSEVVCLTVNYMTGYQIFKRVAKLRPGQRVLVHGAAGGTGSALLDVGRVLGLEMYGTASKPKHDLVSSLGATPIDYRNEDFVERIRGLTGDGVDLVVDHIGGAHLKRSFQTLRAGGLLVSIASTAQVWGDSSTLAIMLGLLQLPLWNILPNKKSTTLFDLVAFNKKNPTWYAEDMKVLIGNLAEGEIKPVIAKRMPLVDARQAQELLLGAKVKGKIVLICS
jgi:NADPH:quinone reductase-like Zn-dependent oxidoreductase